MAERFLFEREIGGARVRGMWTGAQHDGDCDPFAVAKSALDRLVVYRLEGSEWRKLDSAERAGVIQALVLGAERVEGGGGRGKRGRVRYSGAYRAACRSAK